MATGLWAQVVRGESESISVVNQSATTTTSSQPLMMNSEQNNFSDCLDNDSNSSNNNDNARNVVSSEGADNANNVVKKKKQAWKKPSSLSSNGVVSEVVVMETSSWPALADSARISSNNKPDSPKPLSNGSHPIPQEPVIPQSPQKQPSAGAKSNHTSKHSLQERQHRPVKRGNGRGGGPVPSSLPHPPPPPPPPFPIYRLPPSNYGKFVPVYPDTSPRREPPFWGNNWDSRAVGGFVPQSHPANDHGTHRQRPHGDGQYRGRRDHDRGNHEWSSHNGRDHLQSQRGAPRGALRPPSPGSLPFIAPPPVSPFGNLMAYPDMQAPVFVVPALPPDSFGGMPLMPPVPPPHLMFLPVQDPLLPSSLVQQIDFYFSDANLVKDEYLKSNMDKQGWVPITLIASFPRVRSLTNNTQFILECLRTSTIVEVKDDKVRRRNEWLKWVSPGPIITELSSESSGGSTHDKMATSLEKFTLEEVAGDKAEGTAVPSNCPSEEFSHKLHVSDEEGAQQATNSCQ